MSRLSITHEQCVKGRVKEHAWRLNRLCACGAAIQYEAPRITKRCAYCRATHDKRKYHARNPDARWNQNRNANSCKRCGVSANGKTLCLSCQIKHTNEIRAMKAKRKAVNMCTDCGLVPATNGQRCKVHASKANKASTETRMLAIADGKCGRCKKRNRTAYSTHCAKCLEIKREQNRKAAQ